MKWRVKWNRGLSAWTWLVKRKELMQPGIRLPLFHLACTVYPMTRRCPGCGNSQTEGKYCVICGHDFKFQVRRPVKPVQRRTNPDPEAIRERNYATDQTSLVLAILGLLFCGALCPFAIVCGRPGSAGRTLGVIGTVIWVLGVIAILGFFMRLEVLFGR